MFEIMFIIAFSGALIAGFWDLKTTEIPDEIPTVMTVLGIFIWYITAFTFGDFVPLLISITLGTVVLIIGWILYKAGQWGGGDAKLLAGIIYLLPFPAFLFSYVINFFFIALFYLIFYTIILGFMRPKIFGIWFEKLRRDKNTRLGLIIINSLFASIAVLMAIMKVNIDPLIVISLWVFVLFMILFLSYAKVIEGNLFRRKIKVKELKIGDVLASNKRWEGLTADEVREIKKRYKYVEIKEGVRFGLVFAINLIVTLVLGNILLIIFLFL